jgi:hypothetical protein
MILNLGIVNNENSESSSQKKSPIKNIKTPMTIILKKCKKIDSACPNTPNHLLLDSAPNLGPLISPWEINEFENC